MKTSGWLNKYLYDCLGYLLCSFTRYQHSRQLVNALNMFADVHADLPEGWEKKLNKQGKVCVDTLIVHIPL